jgi:F-type H+-transporting ATPase subunit epsilon
MSDSLSITIINAEQTLYEGPARALSSTNEEGPFDVLPMHSNFISIIKDFLIIHHEKGDKKELKIEGGVLRAFENRIQVFLGIETLGKPAAGE